jgi:glycosyltransferase involved in cell wall biosynthesis/polysaccharide pyruvyl transferase WcaK-like protein/MoaA/NifB/PqqE/SkfB family radical SAM enzyme
MQDIQYLADCIIAQCPQYSPLIESIILNYLQQKCSTLMALSKDDIEIQIADISSKLLALIQANKPLEINLQVNEMCNLRCSMCNLWTQKPGNQITLSAFRNLMKDPFFRKVESVGITAGEPIIRDDLKKLFLALPQVLPKFRGASFITNGSLPLKTIRDFADVFREYTSNGYTFQAMVSIDGLYQIHDRVRGKKGSFERAVGTLFELIDLGIPVLACCTLIKENVYHVHDLLDWAQLNKLNFRFRVGHFINRLYNSNQTDQIRNFDNKEIKHLVSFFYGLIEYYEKDPLIQRTYSSIISILTGGIRLISCPYQNSQSIDIDGMGRFFICPCKGIPHPLTPGRCQEIVKDCLKEKVQIGLFHCDNCIHDYHSSWIKSEETKQQNRVFVKNEIYLQKYTVESEVTSVHFDAKRISKILLVGWYGTETAGDIAILGGIIIEYLKQNSFLEFAVLSLFPNYTRLNISDLKNNIPNLKIQVIDYYDVDAFSIAEGYDAIVMAGGPLMDIPQTALIASLFFRFYEKTKPRVIEGCGIGPLNVRQYKNNVIQIIKLATAITIRDSKSIELLRSFGIQKQIKLREDPSITYINSLPVRNVRFKERIIRCYLRELTSEYPQSITPEEAEDNIRTFLLNLLRWHPDYQIELWPMHYFPVGNDDRCFNKRISSDLNSSRIKVIGEPVSVEEIISSMASATFCVCMRFHSVFFASKVKVPFIAVDYTAGGKILGYLSDISQNNRIITLDAIHMLNKDQIECLLANRSINSRPQNIRIAQICTDDIRGGASMAAFRLHQGIRNSGLSSSLIVKNKSSVEPSIFKLSCSDDDQCVRNDIYSELLHKYYINKNRTDLSNTLFTFPLFGVDFSELDLIKNAHIIHLHWISFLASSESLVRLASKKKPVIWTLHDEWVFTGGCHYTSGCTKYLDNCLPCPQLKSDTACLPSKMLQKKRSIIQKMNPIFVTPSRWLAEKVRNIPELKKLRVEVIPNGIDIKSFRPVAKITARRKLGLRRNGFFILFGASDIGEKRKGFNLLKQALIKCLDNPFFAKEVKKDEINLICFGELNKIEINSIGLPVTSLGYITEIDQIRSAYSAADILVLPSLEDNLPNTIIEAMCCGTPSIAFSVGGIPEIIENQQTGLLITPGNIDEMSKAIVNIVNTPELHKRMQMNCRKRAIEEYSIDVVVKKYADLYKEILGSTSYAVNLISISQNSLGKVANDELLDDNQMKSLMDEFAIREIIELKNRIPLVDPGRRLRKEPIDELTQWLEEAQSVLKALRSGKVFRILRKVGLWKGMDEMISQTLPSVSEERGSTLENSLKATRARPKPKLSRIAVDLTPLLPGSENGGAKLLALELVRNLCKLLPDCEFVLLTSDTSHEELSPLDSSNVRRRCVRHQETRRGSPISSKQIRRMWRHLKQWLIISIPPFLLTRLKHLYLGLQARRRPSTGILKEIGADLLFCPFTMPFFYEPAVPAVSVVYDLQHRYYPQFFEWEDYFARERHFKETCRLTDRLICISEFVGETVLKNSDLLPEQVVSIPIRLFRRLKKPTLDAVSSVLQRHGLEQNEFLLYPANFWPHKNHPMLLTAFGMFRSRHPESKLRLVCTGYPDDRMGALQEAARRMGMIGWVYFPGFLSEDEFAALLSSCRALIFPSLYEGFGMPVLEAMAFGKPVLCSEITSLPEVAGDAALYFDPKKPTEILSSIERIFLEPEPTTNMTHRGYERIATLGDAEQMTKEYLQVFYNVIQSRVPMGKLRPKFMPKSGKI